jgi:hypothetical protein
MVAAFLAGLSSGKMAVEFEEWVASARATLKIKESADYADSEIALKH